MHTKYIFLDMDGTLLGSDSKVPESAKKAMTLARKKGHKIFICSGRSKCELHEGILDMPVDGIVGAAGAYVEVNGTMIYHKPMSEQMNRRLLSYLEEKKMSILVETNEELRANRAAMEFLERGAERSKKEKLVFDFGLLKIAKPLEELEDPAKLAINKIVYANSPVDNSIIWEDLKDEYTIMQGSIEMMGNSGEISELGMDKANGIRIVVKYLGADLADTIAFGDGENDMPMLQEAGIGVAMGNAKDMVKEMADYVTGHVDENGLYDAFAHFHLI